jgi:hypothetical protein
MVETERLVLPDVVQEDASFALYSTGILGPCT